MPFIEDLAQQALTQGVGAVFGMFSGNHDRNKNYEMQEKLQELQIKGSKELTDYQKMKELEMWKNTSYPAQIEMLKKAGLNPGLIYGMGGTGGSTTGGGAAVPSGGNASAGEGQMMEGMGMQMGMMAAQKRLLEAQAANVEADTENKEGVERKEGETRIASLTQGIENQKAVEQLTKIQTDLANIDKNVQGKTAEDRIEWIEWQSLKALEELDQVARQTYIQKATLNDKIKIIQQEAIGAVLKNALTSAETNLTKQQTQTAMSQEWLNRQEVKNKINEIMLNWNSASQKDREIMLKDLATDYNAETSQALDRIMGVLSQAVDGILRGGTGGKPNKIGFK